ncbi:MAG: HIT family protein [Gammaproteobacteria bacterium]|nr:HIT family protein [Gammaproteobacteria bacterium]
MAEFKLDPRLQKDCFILSESEQFFVLLMNNSLVPWFILVPKTNQTELFQLDELMQTKVLALSNQIAKFISDEFKTDKLNMAAIGNIVSQLHIHIIGRYKSDAYWPGVVWGGSEKSAYSLAEVERIKIQLLNILVI